MKRIPELPARVKQNRLPAEFIELLPITAEQLVFTVLDGAKPDEVIALGEDLHPLTGIRFDELGRALEDLAAYHIGTTKYIELATWRERARSRSEGRPIGRWSTPHRMIWPGLMHVCRAFCVQLGINGYNFGVDDAHAAFRLALEVLLAKGLPVPHLMLTTGRGLWLGWLVRTKHGRPLRFTLRVRRKLTSTTKRLAGLLRKFLPASTSGLSDAGQPPAAQRVNELRPTSWCKLPLDARSGGALEAFAVGVDSLDELRPLVLLDEKAPRREGERYCRVREGFANQVKAAAAVVTSLSTRASSTSPPTRRRVASERWGRWWPGIGAARYERQLEELVAAGKHLDGFRAPADADGLAWRKNLAHMVYILAHARAQCYARNTNEDRAAATAKAIQYVLRFNRVYVRPPLKNADAWAQFTGEPAVDEKGGLLFLSADAICRTADITEAIARACALVYLVPANCAYRRELAEAKRLVRVARADRRAQRAARDTEILTLRRAGHGIRAIARRLGVGTATVSRRLNRPDRSP